MRLPVLNIFSKSLCDHRWTSQADTYIVNPEGMEGHRD